MSRGKKMAVLKYAQEAFRRWAVNGRLTSDEIREKLREQALASILPPEVSGRGKSNPTIQDLIKADEMVAEYQAELLDIDAAARTVAMFKANDPLTIQCIEGVYLVDPERPTKRGEIQDRVTATSVRLNMSPETVYRRIRDAAIWFAQERGISSTEPTKLKFTSNF